MNLLGLAFNTLSLEEVRDALLARPRSASFTYIVTPNTDHLERLARNPSLRKVYGAALFRLFDSRCLALFLRLLGRDAPPVVTGSDLTAVLLGHLSGMSVAVIGMDDDAFAALRGRYPDIGFLHHNPPMGLAQGLPAFAAAMRFAREADAPFTFFAIGSPLQEQMAHAVMQAGGARGVGLCIGAALYFAAGTSRRAPAWMRCAGLEWLHRLALEPRRLAGRYLLRSPRVFALLLAEVCGFRASSSR